MLKKVKSGLFSTISSLNDSKFFAGIVLICMNIGSKYITIKLSKTQEDFIKNHLGRQVLMFAIAFTATKNIVTALLLTAIFYILSEHLFNEQSRFCIIPEKYRKYHDILDLDGDGTVTEDELKQAKEILEKHKKGVKKKNMMKDLNTFKPIV